MINPIFPEQTMPRLPRNICICGSKVMKQVEARRMSCSQKIFKERREKLNAGGRTARALLALKS